MKVDVNAIWTALAVARSDRETLLIECELIEGKISRIEIEINGLELALARRGYEQIGDIDEGSD